MSAETPTHEHDHTHEEDNTQIQLDPEKVARNLSQSIAEYSVTVAQLQAALDSLGEMYQEEVQKNARLQEAVDSLSERVSGLEESTVQALNGKTSEKKKKETAK